MRVKPNALQLNNWPLRFERLDEEHWNYTAPTRYERISDACVVLRGHGINIARTVVLSLLRLVLRGSHTLIHVIRNAMYGRNTT